MEDVLKISFLITHYNRPYDLAQCINGIRKIPLTNYEIVVSDDGSSPQNIKTIQSYEIDQLVLATVNQGLAANINKGLKVCKGQYIIYCQEDFMISPEISNVMEECYELLENNSLDLIRFTSNFYFKETIPLTSSISRIPKFSWNNFFYNYYQYSDHPFIIKSGFHDQYGYYQEATSGRYGETEYAIRILKSNAKIGITNRFMAFSIEGSKSVLANESDTTRRNNRKPLNKSLIKIVRALRLYIECLLYQKSNRGLKTYRNYREK